MFPVCERSDGAITAKIWEVRAFVDGEPLSFHEVYLRFGSTSPILRLHESDLTSLATVVSRVTDEIDRRNEQWEHNEDRTFSTLTS